MFKGFEFFNGEEDFDEETMLSIEHCDAEMQEALHSMQDGDTVGAKGHIVNSLNIFANSVIGEPLPADADADEMAQHMLMLLIAHTNVGVDPIIDELEKQFA